MMDKEKIISMVCERHGLTPEAIREKSPDGNTIRHPKIAACRRDCAIALYTTGQFSQREIGKALGVHAYSTLGVAFKKCKRPKLRRRQAVNGAGASTVDIWELKTIAAECAEKHGVSIGDVLRGSRNKANVLARAELCWRARTELNATYNTIGAFIGTDHATATYLVGRHELNRNSPDGRPVFGVNRKQARVAAAQVPCDFEQRKYQRRKQPRRAMKNWLEECRIRAQGRHEELIKKFDERPDRNTPHLLTLDEAGAYMGMSRESASKLEFEAMSKLRKGLLEDPYIREWVLENVA